MWRFIYNMIGIEYIGSLEQQQIDRQKHLKHMVTKQIKAGGLKLKPTQEQELFIDRILKKKKKKNR